MRDGISVVLTAGHGRAAHVLLLAHLLLRDNARIGAIIVVTPWRFRRLKGILRSRGRRAIGGLIKKLVQGGVLGSTSPQDAVAKAISREGIRFESLRRFARQRGIPYKTVRSLNEPATISFLKENVKDGVLYGGGGILRSAFIAAARGRILNSHLGPLPEVRGMNAIEWSLLLGFPLTVTVHVIDNGIDTGPVLESRAVSVSHGDDLDAIRSKCILAGIYCLKDNIEALVAGLPEKQESRVSSKQCYVLCPLLAGILEDSLVDG